MLMKGRKKPLPLQKLDIIIFRMELGNSKLLELRRQAAKYQKGFNGECKLDYHLKSLPPSFSKLHDVT